MSKIVENSGYIFNIDHRLETPSPPTTQNAIYGNKLRRMAINYGAW
jgi:hypothetical protein